MYRDNVVQDLLKLIQENPDLPIRAKVDTDVCSGYDYSWFLGDVTSACIMEYAIMGDDLYTDKEMLIEEWISTNSGEFDADISDEELLENAHIATDGMWKKAIFVSVEATEDYD